MSDDTKAVMPDAPEPAPTTEVKVETEAGTSGAAPAKSKGKGTADAPAKSKGKDTADAPDKVKRVKIILDENDEIPPNGQFFGVNGTGYQIQPGKEVEIPEFLLGVIDNAVTTKPVLNDDGQVVGYRDVPRFPYRIVK